MSLSTIVDLKLFIFSIRSASISRTLTSLSLAKSTASDMPTYPDPTTVIFAFIVKVF